jgi:hypothetical protein
MNNLTTEQIKQIIDGAPDGATHAQECDGVYFYFRSDGFLFFDFYRGLVANIDDILHIKSLSDLREILALRERVSELQSQRNKLAIIVGNAIELSFDGCSYDGADVQEHCEAQGILTKTEFNPEIHTDPNAYAEEGCDWYEWSDWFTKVMQESDWWGTKEQSDD